MQKLGDSRQWRWRATVLVALTAAAAGGIGWLQAGGNHSGSAANAPPTGLTLRLSDAAHPPRPDLGRIDTADWALFKSRFIRADGQLIDSHSHVSHSEGQGYAMLLAVAADDRAAFDRAWRWTQANLQHDKDALLAWKWQPNGHGGGAVGDANDAADGDILVAWALHRAAKRWHDAGYDAAARPIARDILNKRVRDIGGFAVLLPGGSGFVHQGRLTVNLSYWIFPAFRSLNEIEPSLRWYQLERSGLYLLDKARFGHDRLPADWIELSAAPASGLEVTLAPDQPLSGFDAIRIPLYLLWDDKASPNYLAPFIRFWHSAPVGKIPATVNLATGATAAYPMLPGMTAIVEAVEARTSWSPLENAAAVTPGLPPLAQDDDYYSAALGLLVRLALDETS